MGGLAIQSAILVNAAQDYGFAGEQWYEDHVFPGTPPSYQMATDYGGHCSLSFGEIVISLEMFDSSLMWPPPKAMPFTYLFVVGDDEVNASILFEGEAYRRTYDREEASYTLHGPRYEADLLTSLPGYGGFDAPCPRAFGSVSYQPALRLPDDAGSHPVYHKAYITGTVGTDWHVTDDGVNIDSNVVDNGDGTFYLTYSPVGEVGISGTGEQTTLLGIFTWACQSGRLALTLDSTRAASPSPTVSHWAAGQLRLIDFLSELAAFYDHFFFIRNGILYLIDMDSDFDVRQVTESDILPVKYSDLAPVAEVNAAWQTRTAVSTGDPPETYVRVDDQTARKSSVYSYGSKITITPYHIDRSVIEAQLDVVLAHVHSDHAQFSVPLDPLLALPLPGTKFVFTDESMIRPVDVWIRARNLTYDFSKELILIEGEGEVAAG